MQIYMYVHTRERDSRPGFDGVKIKLLLSYYYTFGNIMLWDHYFYLNFQIKIFAIQQAICEKNEINICIHQLDSYYCIFCVKIYFFMQLC